MPFEVDTILLYINIILFNFKAVPKWGTYHPAILQIKIFSKFWAFNLGADY